MVNMYKGYPRYTYFGTFEKEFGKEEAKNIIEKLRRNDIIEVDYDISKDIHYYSLSSKGMNFAISMINLNFSNKINYFSKRIYQFTKILLVATGGMLLFSFIQLITSP